MTTAAPATAAGLVLRLIDPQRTTTHLLTVHVLDGAGRIGTRHFDKAETTRTTGFPIVDQRYGFDRAMLRKEGADRRFVGREGQVAHINLAHSILQKYQAFTRPK